jgi:hypothetical protein
VLQQLEVLPGRQSFGLPLDVSRDEATSDGHRAGDQGAAAPSYAESTGRQAVVAYGIMAATNSLCHRTWIEGAA